MSPSLHEFLRHILDECEFILGVCRGKTKEEVLDDATLQRAIVRSIEVIGEATKKVDSEFRNQHPQIDWKKIAGTRDKMIHHYFGIDYDIVWEIITDKIPELHYQLKEILSAK
jgi:uncharacterized protein with HEPN domain